jgi:hypothetical protein
MEKYWHKDIEKRLENRKLKAKAKRSSIILQNIFRFLTGRKPVGD